MSKLNFNNNKKINFLFQNHSVQTFLDRANACENLHQLSNSKLEKKMIQKKKVRKGKEKRKLYKRTPAISSARATKTQTQNTLPHTLSVSLILSRIHGFPLSLLRHHRRCRNLWWVPPPQRIVSFLHIFILISPPPFVNWIYLN